METFGGILAAIIIAIIISAIFYYGFSARGPWGSLWSFFLILFLVIWAASLWVRPVGPVYWDIAWIPLLFIGLVFALLLAAIPIDETGPEEEVIVQEGMVEDPELERKRDAEASTATALGWVFWLFIAIVLIAVIVGYLT